MVYTIFFLANRRISDAQILPTVTILSRESVHFLLTSLQIGGIIKSIGERNATPNNSSPVSSSVCRGK